MNHIKFILISVLWLNILPCFSNANWCIKETTSNMRVTKAHTKIITSRKWLGGIKRKTVWYTVTELVPRITQQRVCCEGYILDRVQNICEPNCPNGCPQFSECIRPNTCECHDGYRMKGHRCEPICEPNCAFCESPYTCILESTISFDQSSNDERTTFVQIEFPTTTTPGTTSEPPSTEISLKDLTTEETSTTFASTEEPPWTNEMAQTSLHYLERNAVCTYEYKCYMGLHLCRRSIKECQCFEGYIKASSGCHHDLGFEASECVKDNLCTSTTEEYQINTDQEQILSSELPETTTLTVTDVSLDFCEHGCNNGLCVNGFCQCPKGSVLSPESNGCIVSSSCDTICHNGTCQEDGYCECQKGFIYQYAKGCVPDDDDDCDKKCINGVCESAGKCKLTGKLEGHNHFEEFPAWIWVVSTVFVIAILGLFVIKRARQHNYNVGKVEKNRHIVQFDCRDV